MKKIFSFLMMMFFALSLFAETEFTFSTSADMNQTKDGITMLIGQGNGQTAPTVTTDYETQKPEMRVYAGNTITISGENLTNIQLVCAKSSSSNNIYTGLSASVGVLVSGGVAEDKNDWKVDRWTGSTDLVVFTFSGSKGQRRIKRILIDGEPIEIEPEEEALPTFDDLDWADYEYQEPEIIHVPNTQLFQKEYAFIDGNVLVHCSKGSIVFASEDEDAYFGCQENQTLEFTATDDIKAVAIKGNVRKNFSASSSAGIISYCTDPDLETAADPVLVVRDVNDWNFTITCNKNLSCYEIRVYFKENPESACEEQGATGIESFQPSAFSIQKELRHGQLMIVRGDKTYNVLGIEL